MPARPRSRATLVALSTVLAATLGATARAAVVFSDGFGDADYNNDGTADNGATVTDANDIGARWLRARGTSTHTLGIANDNVPGGINAGNALSINTTTTSSRVALIAFPAQDITPGKQIVAEFDLRALTAPPFTATDRGFRLGLLNSNGTAAIESGSTSTDPTVQPTADDVGYIGRVETGAASGTTLDVLRNSAGQILGGTLGGIGGTSSNASALLNDNLVHRLVLTLTNVGSDGFGGGADVFTATLQFDAISTSLGTDSAPITTRFDQFAFATNALTLNYLVDNVRISVNPVPEPSAALALASLPALATLRRRRRATR